MLIQRLHENVHSVMKNVSCPVEKNIQSAKLKALNKDTVCFSGNTEVKEKLGYVDESQIHDKVRHFSNQLRNLFFKQFRLHPANIQKMIDEALPEGRSVQLQQMPAEQMNAIAMCAQGVNQKTGEEITALLVDLNMMPFAVMSELAHEFTHALQLFTEKQEELVAKTKAKGEDYHNKIEEAATDYEDKLLTIVNEVFPKYDDEISKTLMLDKNTSLEGLVDKYKFVSEEKFKKDFAEIVDKYNLKDDLLALEYFHNKATKEAMAYAEGNQTYREANSMPDMLSTSDLIPILYQRWADFLQKQIDSLKAEKQSPLMLMA